MFENSATIIATVENIMTSGTLFTGSISDIFCGNSVANRTLMPAAASWPDQSPARRRASTADGSSAFVTSAFDVTVALSSTGTPAMQPTKPPAHSVLRNRASYRSSTTPARATVLAGSNVRGPPHARRRHRRTASAHCGATAEPHPPSRAAADHTHVPASGPARTIVQVTRRLEVGVGTSVPHAQ